MNLSMGGSNWRVWIRRSDTSWTLVDPTFGFGVKISFRFSANISDFQASLVAHVLSFLRKGGWEVMGRLSFLIGFQME